MPSVRQTTEPNHDFTVPNAYRTWSYFANTLDAGCFQVHHAKNYARQETRIEVLCEVYSRAIFEVALGIQYDEADTKVDRLVYRQIVEQFGDAVAGTVHATVEGRGCVARTHDEVRRLVMA